MAFTKAWYESSYDLVNTAMLLSLFAIITKTKWDCCFQPCFGYDELFIWVQRKTKKEANKAYE